MAIIELQGELEGRTEANLQSQFIGDLYFKTQLVSNILLVELMCIEDITINNALHVLFLEMQKILESVFRIFAIQIHKYLKYI